MSLSISICSLYVVALAMNNAQEPLKLAVRYESRTYVFDTQLVRYCCSGNGQRTGAPRASWRFDTNPESYHFDTVAGTWYVVASVHGRRTGYPRGVMPKLFLSFRWLVRCCIGSEQRT